MYLINRTALQSDSYLGRQVAITLAALRQADLDARLEGFEHRPGRHPFIGEHVGKWIDAATGLWLASADPDLKRLLDQTVARLVASQDEDGYLGTYEPALRCSAGFGAGWDVWTAKYCLIGLTSYHAATGDSAALDAARRLADLLIRRFQPGSPSILRTDTHGGMASGSVLIGFTRLYELTAEPSYLDFAHHLMRELDSAQGPHLRPTLLSEGLVSKVGNGKAYEMLSCIHGMLELGRITGTDDMITAAVTAWDDIRSHHLYLTGTASFGEHFHRRGDLPGSASANMGETCVTTTWIQLSAALYRLTGESRYLDEAERSLFNQLAAAVGPDGRSWCYYLPLQGRRDYRYGIECCSSSGPRAIALSQALVFAIDNDDLVVGLYQSAQSIAQLGGTDVAVEMHSGVPFDGEVTLTLEPASDAVFGVRLRLPAWSSSMTVDGAVRLSDDGWVRIPPRAWSGRTTVRIGLVAEVRLVNGTGWNEGRIAFTQGPLVLAYTPMGARPAIVLGEAPAALRDGSAVACAVADPDSPDRVMEVRFRPFAEAGHDGAEYRTWLNAKTDGDPVSLFRGGVESCSGTSPLPGSAVDGDPDTAIHSFGPGGVGEKVLDWVAVELPEPVEFRRVVLGAGIDATTGGWFDTVSVMPELQIREHPAGPWITLAVVENYPSTTTLDDGGIRPGQRFEIRLAEPVTACGLRVRGVGSWGHVHFARRITVSELAAFAS